MKFLVYLKIGAREELLGILDFFFLATPKGFGCYVEANDSSTWTSTKRVYIPIDYYTPLPLQPIVLRSFW